MKTPVLGLVLVIASLLIAVDSIDYYVGISTRAPTTPHLVSPGGVYYGLSLYSKGPFDPLLSINAIQGQTLKFGITTNASYPVYFTTGAGGGSPAITANVTGGSMSSNTTGVAGDVLTIVVDSAFTTSLFYYQGTGGTNMGWYITVTSCVPVAPVSPTPVSPANGSVADIAVTVSWLAAGFGVSCFNGSGSTPVLASPSTMQFRTLIRRAGIPGAPWLYNTQVPNNASPFVSGTTTSRVFTDATLTVGTTYEWAIAAEYGVEGFGLVRTVSPTYLFTTPDPLFDSALAAPVLANGVVLIGRIYPDVPVGFFSYTYYRVNVTVAGGLLTILGSTGTFEVPGAPGQGSINLYASVTNGSSTNFAPSSTSGFNFRSMEQGTTARRSLVIPAPSVGLYMIGVEAVGGAATYALTMFYSCPSNMYLTDPSGTRCTRCPANMVAAHAGASGIEARPCQCARGFFPNPAIAGVPPCLRCPVGGLCDGTSPPQAIRGYWASSSDEAFFYSCPVVQACLGGPLSTCRRGYGGRLCSQCVSGYYSLSGQCYKCPAAAKFNFILGVIILIIFLVLCAELSRWYRKVSSVPVFINFLQTVAILPLFQFGWPQYLNVFFNDLSGFNLNPELTAPECYASLTWQTKWVFTLFLPVIVLGGLSVIYVLIWIVRRVQIMRANPTPIKTSRAWDIICPAFVTFLLFFYVSISRESLSFFDCTKQQDGTYTLDASADQLCYSSDWFSLLPLAIYGVLAYALGIPLILHAWLYTRHAHLFAATDKGERIYRWLGPLYLRYRSRLFYWEAVVFLRKVSLIVVGAFFTSFTLFQATLAIAILVIALWLQMLINPFSFTLTNSLEAFLILAQIALFLVGVLFQSSELPNQSGLQELIFVGIIVLFGATFLYAFTVIAYELRDVYRTITQEEINVMQRQLEALEPAGSKPGADAGSSAGASLTRQTSHARMAPTVGPGDWSSTE